MPAAKANQQQRELVKLLYLEHGHQIASEMSGVRYDLVRQWASRYGWKGPSQSVTASSIRVVTERLTDELADNERETRLSLSRYAKRAARDAETASLRDAPYVKSAAQVAAITHKWNDNSTQANHFTLNTLNINCLESLDTPEQNV
jgi:hypothetical protein